MPTRRRNASSCSSAPAPLFTSGPGSIQDQVLRLCGGENIFATSRVPWPQVSREQVLARQPQAIVVTGDASRIAEAQRFGNISSPFR